MKIKVLFVSNWSEIYLIPRIGLKIYQSDLINMEWFWTYRNFMFSIRFLGFGFGIKIYFE